MQILASNKYPVASNYNDVTMGVWNHRQRDGLFNYLFETVYKSVLPVLYYTMTAADLALQGDRAATAVVLTCTVERRYNAFQYNMILHTVTEPE